MRILITGANAPGVNGTCWSLRQKDLFPTHLELFGSDINNVMDNKYFAKTFYLPSGLDPTYLDKINELCINESIDLVVPQTTIETNFLSQLTDSSTQFKSVILKPRELVSELSNKSKVYMIIESLKMCLNNYKICSNTNDLHEFTEMLGPHDYFIKTSNLSGGRGIVKVVSEMSKVVKLKPNSYHVITRSEAIKVFENLNPENGIVLQEAVLGDEYSIDCYRDKDIEVFIPRIRSMVRSGVSQITSTKNLPNLIEFARKFSNKMNISGVFGLQCILDKNNQISFLECNPRIQGTMVASTLTGENLIGRGARLALGLESEKPKRIYWDTTYVRNWAGTGKVNGKTFSI
jgi:carbamoyl-phosphate synthase large subunit